MFEGKYCLIRATNAGVFCGTVVSNEQVNGANTATVIMTGARRIWSWEGAASLSELAQRGTSKPKECKFPIEVDDIQVFEVIEIIPMTAEAQASVAAVAIWSA